MVEKRKLRITVVKRLRPEEVLGRRPPELGDDVEAECPVFKDVKEFVVDERGQMPQGFCSWAWADIHRDVTHLRFGGDYPWMKASGVAYSCCTDGARPVIFKLERI